MTEDYNALAYWFPLIKAAGVPVPETIIVPMSPGVYNKVWEIFEPESYEASSADVVAYEAFITAIDKAAIELGGYPVFLRTDHTSHKHNWDRSCFLRSEEDIKAHVLELIEFSEMVSMAGLPYKNWAVRTLLPVTSHGVCPRYLNMPITREWRFFVKDGEIVCHHPYWPRKALEQGGARFRTDPPSSYEILCDLDAEEMDMITAVVLQAARAVPGEWSIDVMEVAGGGPDGPHHYVTDMAKAKDSFHWPDCPHGF